MRASVPSMPPCGLHTLWFSLCKLTIGYGTDGNVGLSIFRIMLVIMVLFTPMLIYNVP